MSVYAFGGFLKHYFKKWQGSTAVFGSRLWVQTEDKVDVGASLPRTGNSALPYRRAQAVVAGQGRISASPGYPPQTLIQAPHPLASQQDRTMEADSRPAEQEKLQIQKQQGAIRLLQMEPEKQRNSISLQSFVLRSFQERVADRDRQTDFLLQADPGDKWTLTSLQILSHKESVMLNFQISKISDFTRPLPG